MATRTTYTSSIRVPIYASWKCTKCDGINFSYGSILCQRQTSTSSMRSSKQREAKEKASNLVQSAWAENALGIIFHPKTYAQNIRSDLTIENTNCTKCGKKAKWDKGMWYSTFSSLALLPMIISGIVSFSMMKSIIAWLVFAILFGVFVYGFISEISYKKMVKNLPEEYLPVIGSLNEELISYAAEKGKKIPSPEETIEIVNHFNSIQSQNSTNKNQYGFCRRCGTPLLANSGFCHKCGEKIIKLD